MSLMRRLGAALRSLRWRLTLTYLVLIAVLLAALGAFQYVTLQGSLIASRVDDLKFDLAAAQQVYKIRGATLTAARRVALLTELVSESWVRPRWSRSTARPVPA